MQSLTETMLFVFTFIFLSCRGIASAHVTFNSSATLSLSQIQKAGLSSRIANNVAVALNFERSNWVNGSVAQDAFYRVPSNATGAPAGALLKLQSDANTSAYTLPLSTAISRIMFQTKTLNGSTAPASAYILWPYLPLPNPDRYPVVGFAHGTSGILGDCAPSHIRNLWYQFNAPYTLALQGYVVVAPDFRGLGVDQDPEGRPILPTYCDNPSAANDMFYAVEAAQTAFPQLSKQFVMMGHSLGGGAAWGCAQRQAMQPVEGYLGTIAASPLTNLSAQVDASPKSSFAVQVARGLSTIYPRSNPSDIITPAAINRFALLAEIGGCNSALGALYSDIEPAVPNWQHTEHMKAFVNLTINGGRPISGPLLVLQGEADPDLRFNVTTAAVNSTCERYPQSELEYIHFAGVHHIGALYASQQIWLSWIGDRFAGRKATIGCRQSGFSGARPIQSYQTILNWFIEYATESSYEENGLAI